ncbi:hypothetical protein Cgig2_012213 [Carnegiea gigantea]|uniref:Short-chain type dehydrogenase/reductase n=1 Tax=Carnegiea gigantea TaxID=171969 RepID=A0A9Q1KTF1_9CARY|nr:hypothetical protein Cgig2_012213 [Carnegiea gigantea]
MACKVAIVTGASRGIGKAISLHLASMGARVVINYTSTSSQSDAETLAAQMNSATPSSSPRAAVFRADVSDPTQVKSLFDFAEHTFKTQPHILIANAAITNPKFPTIAATETDDFDRVFSVNARGTFLCLREAANRLVRGGGGRIVTVSTSLVAAPCARSGAYTPSKAAVELMTKVVAQELRGSRITANVVAPGPITTDMFYVGKTEERIEEVKNQSPLQRLGKVEDVAPLVGFLVTDAGEWVNGQVVRVNGGFV